MKLNHSNTLFTSINLHICHTILHSQVLLEYHNPEYMLGELIRIIILVLLSVTVPH